MCGLLFRRIYDNGIGLVMEIYGSKVVFKVRNFAKGEYLPQYNIEVEL